MPPFVQDAPRLANTYEADRALRDLLARLLPADVQARLAPEWRDLGEAAAGPLADLARQAEAEPPVHVPFDAWGRRIDEVHVSPAWTELHREAARRGLVALPYERGLGPHARIHQFALLNLYGPSSAICSCPLAMTDGAARTLLEHGSEALVRHAVPRLTSRDPDRMWTSGQWMTEKTGGSDVSGTSTVARRGEDGAWRLHGTKWFTSAVTSEMALTLARPEDAPGTLSLFFLETRRADGALNGLVVHRLKDKLGTRALPTAELTLDGAAAVLVGEAGRGVKAITPLLNITRLHNAISACGMMARVLHLARDYARRRRVFGEPLARKPLHQETLAGLQVDYEAALALTFECARLLGRVESGEAGGAERAALRLLTPVAKLMTAKQAVAVASEGLEAFGGAGYVEDTGLPIWLRDAQVLPIWEGTTNVLSLDVQRALARDGVLEPWAEASRARLAAVRDTPAAAQAAAARRYLDETVAAVVRLGRGAPDDAEAVARAVALALGGAAAAVGLVEQAAWAGASPRALAVASRWLRRAPRLDVPEVGHRAESALVSGLEERT